MNAYANWTTKKISAEYRAAYADHQQLAHDYAEGRADDKSLLASANNLKGLRAAFAAEQEANQVRKH